MNFDKEEFLNVLHWGFESFTKPSYRTLGETFEGWAYRKGYLREIHRLEQRRLVEAKPGTVDRIYRLTETGRVAALGGCDPEARWERSWDGRWRVVGFDLPEKHNAARVRLRRYLKDHRFGYLQNSFWVTPDPLDSDLKELAAKGEDVESLVTLLATPCCGISDSAIVSGAWDFERTRELHEECLRVLDDLPKRLGDRPTDIGNIRRWAGRERAAWQAVVATDPLLPRELLPSNYLGAEVWQRRIAFLREAGAWLK